MDFANWLTGFHIGISKIFLISFFCGFFFGYACCFFIFFAVCLLIYFFIWIVQCHTKWVIWRKLYKRQRSLDKLLWFKNLCMCVTWRIEKQILLFDNSDFSWNMSWILRTWVPGFFRLTSKFFYKYFQFSIMQCFES